MESYASFYVAQNTNDGIKYFCGLSDYSSLSGVKKNIFEFTKGFMEEEVIKQKNNKYLHDQKRILGAEESQRKFVTLIYSIIVEFLTQHLVE